MIPVQWVARTGIMSFIICNAWQSGKADVIVLLCLASSNIENMLKISILKDIFA